MKKKMRLYKTHDMDLISIYKNRKINFQKFLKECLRNVAAGKRPHYYIPENNITSEDIKHVYQIIFYLDEKEDADIIKFLDDAKNRQTNSLIRSVIRSCVVAPLYFNCLEHPMCYECKDAPEKLLSPPLKYQKKHSNKKNIKNEKLSHNINELEDYTLNTKNEKFENKNNESKVNKDESKKPNDEKTPSTNNSFLNSLQGMLSQF